MIITTGQGDGDCGFDFKEGQEYLVYANESTMYGAKSLASTFCDRTNELSILQEDLTILGEGQQPIEAVDLTSKYERNQFYIWAAIVITIGILLISVFRRRKHDGVNRS